MANKFWLGGTGNWDGTTNSSASWGTASGGGTTPTNGPGVNDVAIFDAASGGGTVTTTGTITVQGITCGAFTGTLDFSANNNNATLSTTFSCNNTGTRTINMGSGTWTFSSTAATTIINIGGAGLTLSAASVTIVISGVTANTRTFAVGTAGQTFGTVTVNANSSGGAVALAFSVACTITTLNVAAPNYVLFGNTLTTTITNALSATGSSGSEISFVSNSVGNVATISSANNGTFTWSAFRDMTFTGGGTFSATSSFDLGHNTGITITAPASGGGGISRARAASGF